MVDGVLPESASAHASAFAGGGRDDGAPFTRLFLGCFNDEASALSTCSYEEQRSLFSPLLL